MSNYDLLNFCNRRFANASDLPSSSYNEWYSLDVQQQKRHALKTGYQEKKT